MPLHPNIPLRKGDLTPFAGLLEELRLTDMWRLRHAKQYSCCSASYSSLSRINLGLGNGLLIPLVVDSEDGDRHISDHSSLCVIISLPNTAKSKCWKLNPFSLSRTRPHKRMVKTLYSRQYLNSAHLNVIWDTAKAYILTNSTGSKQTESLYHFVIY